MGVIAVGDFDPRAVERAIGERFTSLENPSPPRPRPETAVPHDAPPAVTIHVDPELSMPSVTLLDRVERQRRASRDDYRGELVESLYFAVISRRLAELRDSPHSVLVKSNVRCLRLARALEAYEYAVTSREGKLENALYLVASVLERVLELRLQDVLRHELGGIYSLGVRSAVQRDPAPRRALSLQFTCAPENVARLRKAVFDELAAVAKNGVSADYLDKARAILQRRDEADRRSDAWWLARLVAAYRHEDDFARANDIAAVLARATSADVRRTAASLFDPRRYVLVVMQPSAGATSPASPTPALVTPPERR